MMNGMFDGADFEVPINTTQYVLSEKKHASVETGSLIRDFTYRIQDVASRSSVFRQEIARYKENRGQYCLIGVLFNDGKFAWSNDVPRHQDLVKSEGEKPILARIQTMQPVKLETPDILVTTLRVDSAMAIVGFMEKSGVKRNLRLEIDLTNDLDGNLDGSREEIFHQTVYSGTLGNCVSSITDQALESST